MNADDANKAGVLQQFLASAIAIWCKMALKWAPG